ncbi:unnamed protein product, partial [Rotaria sp. Silwood2]
MTIVLDEEISSDSSWPAGTESWFIHEIELQRKIFACKAVQEELILTQPTGPIKEKPPVEDLLEFTVNNRLDEKEYPTVRSNDNQSQSGTGQTPNLLVAETESTHASRDPVK